MSRTKLLLADDSVTVQKVVNLTFAERGMDVIAFSDGEAALGHFDEVKPDIILADVNMPGINGYQLCELLRTDNANQDLPIVLLVGSFEPFDRDEAKRVGANMHLTKPFASIAELISKVEGLIQQNRDAAAFKPAVSEPSAPGPETNDIDSLYEQSFAETVEIPLEQEAEYELANIDDEMIQTSYADPELNAIAEESYYASDDADELPDLKHSSTQILEPEMVRGDLLETAETVGQAVGADAEISYGGVPETADNHNGFELEFSPEPEQPPPAYEPEPAREVSVYDPFDSIAADAPPIEDVDNTYNAVKFSFVETDLLDLPPLEILRPAEHKVTNAVAGGQQVVNLSPEQMEMIVQKVLERLEQKR